MCATLNWTVPDAANIYRSKVQIISDTVRMLTQIVIIIGAYQFYQPLTEFLSNILLSRLIPYAKEIIGDHQCGFRPNRSTIDHILCIRQILEKKWEYNEEVHQLFIDFKKPYDSVRREVI